MQLRIDLHENFERNDDFFPFYYYEPHFNSEYSILKPHWHDDLEIWYCQCNGIAILNDTRYEFQKDDIIIVNKKIIHSFEMISPELIHIFLFDYSFIEFEKQDFCQEKIIHPLKTEQLLLSPYITCTHTIHNKLKSILNDFLILYREQPLGYELKIKSLIYDMLFLFYTNNGYTLSNEQLTKKQSHIYAIQNTVAYMETHLAETVTVDELCHIANISKFHFIRLFKELTTYSPMQYLMNIRLAHSAKLLLNTSDTITSICYSIGFNDLGYFTKQFKKKYQITPSDYRNKH